MTTARDAIYRALRMLGVSDPEETPSAPQAEFGLMALNQLVHSWKGLGVDVFHTDWTLDSDIGGEFKPQHHQALAALLAIALQPEYPGTDLPQATALMAQVGWVALQADYLDTSQDSDLTVDSGLRVFQANRWWRSSFNTG